MGARINYVFKQDNSGHNITLYSHWGQHEWESDLQGALAKAQPRWADPTYATRIAISQLIGDQWGEETGFGIFVSDEDTEWWDDVVTIDFLEQTVDWDGDNCVGFEQFIAGEYEVEEDED